MYKLLVKYIEKVCSKINGQFHFGPVLILCNPFGYSYALEFIVEFIMHLQYTDNE